MKNRVLLIAVIIFLAVPAVVFAQAEMKGRPCPAKNFQKEMLTQLNLSSEQTALFKKAQAAGKTHMEAMREIFESEGEDAEPSRRPHGPPPDMVFNPMFDRECEKTKPDFSAVAAKMKKHNPGDSAETFEVMVDATAAFYKSLSADQRRILVESRPEMPDMPPPGPPPDR